MVGSLSDVLRVLCEDEQAKLQEAYTKGWHCGALVVGIFVLLALVALLVTRR